MPICNKCSVERELDSFEFRKDRGCYRTVCKICRNALHRKNYAVNANKVAKYRKSIRENNKEDANRKSRKRYWEKRETLLPQKKTRRKQALIENPQAVLSERSSARKWRSRPENKLKCCAHQKVLRALKNGILTKSTHCQMCGKEEKLHGHHHDYGKPLDIIWVCPACHILMHSKYYGLERHCKT